MSARWRKVLADLWANKARTLLVVLSIAVGVFAVGLVAQAYLILDEATTTGYQAVNPSSAFIFLSDFDQDIVDTVTDLPEVAEAEGRRVRSVRFYLRDRWYTAELSALDYEASHVNIIEPIDGRTVPDDRELLIDQTAQALTPFAIGDTAVVEMPDGRQFEMPIVGKVRDQNANPSINSGGINIYTTLETFSWLGESPRLNRLLYVAAERPTDGEHVKALTGDIKDRLERSGLGVYATLIFVEPGISPVKFIVEAIRSILGVLALSSLALSAILVFNTMSALLMRQVPYIGIMKAVGARQGQLARMYIFLVLVFGLLAFLLALLPAAWAAYALAGFVASPSLLGLPLPSFALSLPVVGLELVISLLVPLLAALPAIRRGTAVTVHTALSTQGLTEEDLTDSLLARVVERVRFATGPWLLSLGNVLRDRRRTLLTLGTLILGGSVFIGVLSVSASANRTVAEMGEAYRSDVQVDLDRPYRLAEIKRLALSIPGVERVEGWATARGSILNEQGEEGNGITLLALPAGSDLTHPKIVAGRWLRPGDTNALVVDTSLLREQPELRVGDTITVKMDGREEPWQIIGVFQSLGYQVIYQAYGDYDYVSRLVRQPERTERIQLVTSHHSAQEQAAMAQVIEDHLREQGVRASAIQTSTALRDIIKDQFDVIVSVLMAMAMLITLVGGLGLAGTMSLSVMERTREIGVLRALGASDRMVMSIVLAEGVLLALVSWSGALLFAVPAGKMLSGVVGRHIANGPLTFVYSVEGAALWLLLVVVVAIVASYAPARSASRLTVRDVLAYE